MWSVQHRRCAPKLGHPLGGGWVEQLSPACDWAALLGTSTFDLSVSKMRGLGVLVSSRSSGSEGRLLLIDSWDERRDQLEGRLTLTASRRRPAYAAIANVTSRPPPWWFLPRRG